MDIQALLDQGKRCQNALKLDKPPVVIEEINIHFSLHVQHNELLKNLLIDLQSYNIPYHNEIASIDVLKEFFVGQCSEVIMPGTSEISFEPIQDVRIVDNYGAESFDLFHGLMSIRMEMVDRKAFPLKWRISSECRMNYVFGKLVQESSSNSPTSIENLPIEAWIQMIFTKDKKSQQVINSAIDILSKLCVQSPSDMIDWTEHDWDSITSPVIRMVLFRNIQEFKEKRQKKAQENSKENKSKGFSHAQIIGSIHNIKRYFCYHVSKTLKQPLYITTLSYLDPKAISLAIDEIKSFYSGDQLLQQMEETYQAFAVAPDVKFARLSRGILLYGPPGTGKTTLTYHLPTRMGFVPMAPPLAAAEVNRPYVGQTEALLKDLLSRAMYFPHLICTVSVDEIDGLAPKRDEKSNQSKVDGLSVLLSYIGGINDVENLVFFGSTNRIKMMDEAFLRRLNAQFFVGRPNPATRRVLLTRAQLSLNEQKEKDSNIVTISNADIQNLVIWTANFSGAALDALVSEMIVYSKQYLAPKKQKNFTDTIYLRLIDKVSKQFNLSIGSTSLGAIFNEMRLQQSLEGTRKCGRLFEKYYAPVAISQYGEFHSSQVARTTSPDFSKLYKDYTGLILVDLMKGCIIYETKDRWEYNEEQSEGPRSLQELLPLCVRFAADNNLDSIQLFNLDLLLQHAAYDDTKSTEIIQEKVDECCKYPMCMAILDVDSTVGLSDNESNSNMGLSSSSSVSNSRMYSLLTNIMDHRKVSIHSEVDESKKISPMCGMDQMINDVFKKKDEKVVSMQFWVVVVVHNNFLLKRILREKVFKTTKSQEEEDRKAEEEAKTSRLCKICGQDFLKADNEKLSCAHHDGALFYAAERTNVFRPYSTDDILQHCREKFDIRARMAASTASNPSFGSGDFYSELPNFKYICCYNPYGHPGCRKGYHSEEKTLDEVRGENSGKYRQRWARLSGHQIN